MGVQFYNPAAPDISYTLAVVFSQIDTTSVSIELWADAYETGLAKSGFRFPIRPHSPYYLQLDSIRHLFTVSELTPQFHER